MDNTTLVALYKDAYCSKEALDLSKIFSIPGQWITKQYGKLYQPWGIGKVIKGAYAKSPALRWGTGIAAAGGLGYYGYNTYQTAKKNSVPYKLQKWIKDNPWVAGSLAAGLLTSPLWLPPLASALIHGSAEKQGVNVNAGSNKNNFQMGYYPGR